MDREKDIRNCMYAQDLNMSAQSKTGTVQKKIGSILNSGYKIMFTDQKHY